MVKAATKNGRTSAQPDAAPDEDADVGDEGQGLDETFERTVADGEYRLTRSWRNLLATGLIGGFDVGVGFLALLLVKEETGSLLLAGLAFGIGFIALTLAQSELFTENFLVPVAAVTAQRASVRQLFRLWLGTASMNLVGGWVMMGLVMAAQPALRDTAVDLGKKYATFPAGQLLALSILGGIVITLMTWMQHATESEPAKLIVAVSTGFLLIAGTLSNTIVASLSLFAALHAGAPFGYADWLGVVGVVTAGNLIGGLGLVTVLRLVQVGHRRIENEQPDA